MKSILAGALVVLTGCALNAQAGVYVEMVTRDRTTGKEEPAQRMFIQDGKARIESGASGRVTLFKDDTLFMLDTQRKTYTAMDRATLERSASAMTDMMAKMRAQMASMPPEQRAMMENMMKKNGLSGATEPTKPVVLDATPTGASESVTGRTCKVWIITTDAVPSSQACVVAFAGLPGKDEFQAFGKKMGSLFEKLPESFRQAGGNSFQGNPFQQDNGVGAKMNGFPFISRSYRNGALDSKEMVVKTWRAEKIAATQLEIPVGYTKQETPTLRTGK